MLKAVVKFNKIVKIYFSSLSCVWTVERGAWSSKDLMKGAKVQNILSTTKTWQQQSCFWVGRQYSRTELNIMIMENDVVLLRLSQAQLTQVDKYSFRARLGLKSFLLSP